MKPLRISALVLRHKGEVLGREVPPQSLCHGHVNLSLSFLDSCVAESTLFLTLVYLWPLAVISVFIASNLFVPGCYYSFFFYHVVIFTRLI